jgi:hypothetical protein
MLEHQIKHRQFESQHEILQAITKSWDDLAFAEVQSVFWEWVERLTWIAVNNGKCYRSSKAQFTK